MHQSQVNMCFPDGTEKPKIPSKFGKRSARYDEFGYKTTGSCLGLLSDRM